MHAWLGVWLGGIYLAVWLGGIYLDRALRCVRHVLTRCAFRHTICLVCVESGQQHTWLCVWENWHAWDSNTRYAILSCTHMPVLSGFPLCHDLRRLLYHATPPHHTIHCQHVGVWYGWRATGASSWLGSMWRASVTYSWTRCARSVREGQASCC